MGIENARAALQLAIDELRSCIDGPPPGPVYTARTDRRIQEKPPLPQLGPAGFSFPDPAFNSRILRVTDATQSGLSWRVPSNANVAGWSADSLTFNAINSGGGIQTFRFDPAAFTATPIQSPYSQTEPECSRTDPDVMYTVGGPNTRTIRKYSIASQTFTDIIELDSLVPGLNDPRTYCGGVLCAGDPEVLAVLFGGTGQDQHHRILYEAPSGRILFDSIARLGYKLHGFSLERTGRRLLLYPVNGGAATGIPQVFLWDTQTDTLSQPPCPAGHGAVGFGVWVNQDVNGGLYDAAQWVFRDLATPTVVRNLIDPVLRPVQSEGWADHTSWHHALPDRLVPVISSTYRTAINHNPWRAWDDEVIAIDTTGAGTVWRFCHHRANANDFAGQPLITVAPNGKYAIFQSDWEGSLGANRSDVFVVELK